MPINHVSSQAAEPWSEITSKPSTLAGFGITDAQPLNSELTTLAARQTTLAGYGITDAQPLNSHLTALAAGPTTLAGYGITDAQPLNSHLTALAAGPTTLAGYGITDAQPLNSHLTTLAAGPTTLGGYGITDGQPLNTLLTNYTNGLIAAASTNTTTAGTSAQNTIDVAVQPTANSVQVTFGLRTQVTYNSSKNTGVGGYATASQDVVNTQGTGTHDKIVGKLTQLNMTGGNVNSAVGLESEIASLGASTTVGSYAAFLVPNLSGVANIGNVTNFYSFACQHVNSASLNMGRTLNGQLLELTPDYHPGLAVGRYYSAPYTTISTFTISTGTVYFVPVFVPARTTLTKLGFTVTTALASSSARLAIYDSVAGVPQNLVIDAGTVSTTTTGDKEITISKSLEAGCYFLAAQFDHAITVNVHDTGATRVSQYGAPASNTSAAGHTNLGTLAYAFAAFPTTAGSLTYTAAQIEPHLWFRP